MNNTYVLFTCKSHASDEDRDVISAGMHTSVNENDTEFTYTPLHLCAGGTPRFDTVVPMLIDGIHFKPELALVESSGNKYVEFRGKFIDEGGRVIPIHVDAYYEDLDVAKFTNLLPPTILNLLKPQLKLAPGWFGHTSNYDAMQENAGVLSKPEVSKVSSVDESHTKDDIKHTTDDSEHTTNDSKHTTCDTKHTTSDYKHIAGDINIDTLDVTAELASDMERMLQEATTSILTEPLEESVVPTEETPMVTEQASEPIISSQLETTKTSTEAHLETATVHKAAPLVIEDTCLIPKAQWATQFATNNTDAKVFAIICESDYSENPILKGVINVEEYIDEDATDLDVSTLDVETLQQFTTYNIKYVTLGELLSSEFEILNFLDAQGILTAHDITPRYCFEFNSSITLEYIINSCISCILIPKKSMHITEADILDAVSDLERYDISELADKIQMLLKYDGLQDSLDMHTFQFNDRILSYFKEVPAGVEQYIMDSQSYYGEILERRITKEDDKLFFEFTSLLPKLEAFKERKDKVQHTATSETVRTAGVANLRQYMPGLARHFEFFDSVSWRDIIEDYPKFAENRDKIVNDMVGTYDNSYAGIYENEKAFLAAIQNYISCGLILENNVVTKEELQQLIDQGVESQLANDVIQMWCKVALGTVWACTGQYSDIDLGTLLGYKDQYGVEAAENHAYYKVTQKGTDLNAMYSRDYAAYSQKQISAFGFDRLQEYMNKHTQGTFKWAEALIKCLRWGARKPAFLVLSEKFQPNRDICFEMATATTTEAYTTANFSKMQGVPLYPALTVDYWLELKASSNKVTALPNYANIITELEGMKTQRPAIPGFIQMKRKRSDLNMEEIIYTDMVSLVESLYNFNGWKEGETITPISWLKYDATLKRIIVDPQLSEPRIIYGSSFIEYKDETLRQKQIASYQTTKTDMIRAVYNKPNDTRDINSGLQSRNVYLSTPLFTEKLNAYCDAANFPNNPVNGIHRESTSPFSLLGAFMTITTLFGRRPATQTIMEMSQAYVLPSLVASYLLVKYGEKFGAIEDTVQSFEIKLNCILYGYLYGTQQLGMNPDSFLEALHTPDTAFNWQPMPNALGGVTEDTEYFALGMDARSTEIFKQCATNTGIKIYQDPANNLEARLLKDSRTQVNYAMFSHIGDIEASIVENVPFNNVLFAVKKSKNLRIAFSSKAVHDTVRSLLGI